LRFIHLRSRAESNEESYPVSVEELAKQQGVSPVTDTDTLLADFWPESDSLEEFAATIRRWRSEEG
jgi:hypothetical protein